METNKLLCCPFCGGRAEHEPESRRVRCIKCECIAWNAASWNRRAAPDAPAVQASKSRNLIAVDRGALQLALNTLRRNAEERGFTVQGEIADELQKSARTIPPAAKAVQAEPVAWALYVRRKETEWTRYMLYDTEFRANRSMQRIAGDPLIVEIRPLYEHPPAATPDPVADKLAEALKTAVRVFGKYLYPGEEVNAAFTEISAALAEYEQKGGNV